MIRRAVAGIAVLLAAAGAIAAAAPRDAARLATPIDPKLSDAARRLLLASRFRERQEVLVADSIRAGESDLIDDCVTRAAQNRALNDCGATAAPSAQVRAALAAGRPRLIDDIMAESQTVYASHFTAAELDELTRFFQSPIGVKYGRVYPVLLSEVQARKRALVRRYLTDAHAASARGTKPAARP